MSRIAFLGLGVMGFPMAGHLQRAGHDVTVYNRTGSRANDWIGEFGGTMQPTPGLAAADAEIVFSCVGNDDDVRAVTLGRDGAFAALAEGGLFVDHTTTSAGLARELDRVAAGQGLRFVDAPVSGGQAGAESGTLSVMMGGDPNDTELAARIVDSYARICTRIGPAGSGQLAKMVNQICIAGLLQSLAEGIHFAETAGLDIEAVLSVISEGAAQSWQMDNRALTMARDEFDFGFAVDWMRKDLGYVLEEGRRLGTPLPVTALVDQFYSAVQAIGGGRWDTSSLIAALRKPDD